MTESQKRAVTIFTIIISLLPCFFLLQFPRSGSLQLVALYAAAAIGYMGVTLLLWMYMLGTRAVSTLVFRDLAPMLSIHKWLGKYATPLIFIHPILITFSRSEVWFFSLIPQVSTGSGRHILLGQIAAGLLALTWFVSAYLRERIGFRPWKYLHYLAYICVPFALLHALDFGSQEQSHILVRAYLYLLIFTFLIFTILRLRSLLNLDRLQYTVVSNVELTDIDHQIVVRPVGNHLASSRNGQYVYIKLGYISEDHPFSVTHHDETTHDITLTYRTAGMYTKELAKLQPGSQVFMAGPYGTFTDELTEDHAQPVIYLVGGIGITPFVDRIIKDAGKRDQWLFHANRNSKTAVLSQTLRETLGSRWVGIFGDATDQTGNNIEQGFLSAALLTKYVSHPQQYHYYICGPVPMMDAARRELATLGIDPSAIHSEKFGW